jgi:hypothetical protein
MRRTRHVLVMTLVATALCADRVATAAPQLRAQLQQASADPIARLANHLATKLSGTFRRVASVARLNPSTRDRLAPQARPENDAVAPVGLHLAQGNPFQFRLPPPSL